MKVIISGGGTGGHLYPALAIGRAYRDLGHEIYFVGSNNGIEAKVMPNEDIPYSLLDVEGLSRKPGVALVRGLIKAKVASNKAGVLVKAFKPDLIIGTGGYSCYPVLSAGVKAGVATMVHEANAVLGLSNRRLAKMVDCLCVNYKATVSTVKNAKRIAITGMPIRQSIINSSRLSGGEYLDVDDDKLVVLVTGGSQGAKSINAAMSSVYEKLGNDDKILFYHIVGRNNYEEFKPLAEKYKSVKVMDYEDNMDLVLARTDIAICRAGASFLAEIAVKGIPAILVPYPYAANGHQEDNARVYHNGKGAVMLLDNELQDKLLETLCGLIMDKSCRNEMSINMRNMSNGDALDRIINIGLTLVEKKALNR